MVPPPVLRVGAERAVELQTPAADDPDAAILSQIRDLNGIVAVSVFNEKRTIIMMGDEDSEFLVKIARTMLETAKKMTPRLTWGPLVHMTLQIPAGNMIIAPYRDNYLCLLTTRTINIGHIRRILRDLQQKNAPQCVSLSGTALKKKHREFHSRAVSAVNSCAKPKIKNEISWT